MPRNKLDEKYDARLPEIGRRLRAVRDHANLSQEQIATVLGFTRRQWSSWEYGEITLPVWALLELAEIYGIDPDWVIRGGSESPRTISQTALMEKRLRKISAKVSRAVQNLGLVVTPEFEQSLVQLIIDQPEESEHLAIKNVSAMLRRLAHGKGPFT